MQTDPGANERALEATSFVSWDTIGRRQTWCLTLSSLTDCRCEVEVLCARKVSLRVFTSVFPEEVTPKLKSKVLVGVSS